MELWCQGLEEGLAALTSHIVMDAPHTFVYAALPPAAHLTTVAAGVGRSDGATRAELGSRQPAAAGVLTARVRVIVLGVVVVGVMVVIDFLLLLGMMMMMMMMMVRTEYMRTSITTHVLRSLL
jgi:hypothetical protein